MFEGEIIDDNWEVLAPISRPLDASGGVFSLAYKCRCRRTDKVCFMKITDFQNAMDRYLSEMGFADLLVKIGEEHKFESGLIELCNDQGLDKIVRGIDYGDTRLKGYAYPVLYIVFEWTDFGDVHKYRKENFDLFEDDSKNVRWWFKVLHHAAIGLDQLHKNNIVHQDLKPSNILIFGHEEAKLSDLGRAVSLETPSRNDRKSGAT